MRKVFIIGFYFLILIVITSGCNKIPKHAYYIPKDALLVGSIDMSKLAKKMIWNAITGSELFDEIQKSVKNEKSKEAMKDFSSIGLEQASNIYFFYTGNLRSDGKMCFLVGMKSQEQFEKFINENLKSVKVVSKGSYQTATLEESVYAAWNKDVAMFFPLKSDTTDSTSEQDIAFNSSAFNNLQVVDSFLVRAFALTEKESVVSLPNFKTLQKERNDVSIWANYEQIYRQNMNLAGGAGTFIKMDYFKNAALATGFNFEDGSIDVEMDYYFSDELASIYGKHSTDNVDEKLVAQIPSKDVAMLLAYNLKPQMITDILKEFKMDGLVNMGLVMMGTSMERIGEAFKGDMVCAITDVNLQDTIPKIPNSDLELVVEPQMHFSVAMNIGNESAMNDLLKKGIKENVLTQNEGIYRLGEMTLLKSKDKVIFSSSNDLAKQYMNGGNNLKNHLPEGAWQEITGHPFSFFLDVKKMIRLVPIYEMKPKEKEIQQQAAELFTYIEIHGGKLKKKANHMEGHVYFSNKKENALIQLLNLAVKIKQVADEENSTLPSKDSLSS